MNNTNIKNEANSTGEQDSGNSVAAIVYSGRHYGRQHRILEFRGCDRKVWFPGDLPEKAFWVHISEIEILK